MGAGGDGHGSGGWGLEKKREEKEGLTTDEHGGRAGQRLERIMSRTGNTVVFRHDHG